jgi:hypothetical protein
MKKETLLLLFTSFFDSGDCRLLAGGSFHFALLFINFIWKVLSYYW